MNFFPPTLPTQVTGVIYYYYSTATRGTWAMEWRSCFLAGGAASGNYYASKPLVFCQWKCRRHAQSAASPAWDAGSYYTYARFMAMDNGNGEWNWKVCIRSQLQDLLWLVIRLRSVMEMEMDKGSAAWCAAPAPGNYCGGASGFGNGEWRRISCTCVQLPVPLPVLMSTTQKGRGQWAMESMEGATKPEKIYSNV